MRLLCLLALVPALVSAADNWKPLFNGKDLTGWKMTGPGQFVIADGTMKTSGGMGLLFYEKEKIGDATIRVVYKTVGTHDNSGVIIRLPDPPPDPWYGVHYGYEVQIDAAGDDWHTTGAIYSISKVTSRAQKPSGEWNTMDIEIRGPLTTVWVNGTKVNEYKQGQEVPLRKMWFEPVRGPRPDSGFIALQNHDAGSTVYFKEISVKPLK